MNHISHCFKYLTYLFFGGMSISAIISLILSLTNAQNKLIPEILVILIYILLISIISCLVYFYKDHLFQILSNKKERKLIYN